MKKIKKILVMGLPGSGKTTLSKILSKELGAVWLNADQVRKKFNDWDFTSEGRSRQAKRMLKLSEEVISSGKSVVADFICPTEKTRSEFKADFIIWMDTIEKGRFEDTNQMFEKPKTFNFRVLEKNAEKVSKEILKELLEN